jgi:hypothetical protein
MQSNYYPLRQNLSSYLERIFITPHRLSKFLAKADLGRAGGYGEDSVLSYWRNCRNALAREQCLIKPKAFSTLSGLGA